MIVKTFLINTFIDRLFSGGQALVAILRQRSQTPLLQTLACELKAPVTAYVLPYQEGFAVRYFTATGELDSGGYAALAVAKALYSAGLAPPSQPLRLEGLSGPVLLRPSTSLDEGVSLVLPPAPPRPADDKSLPAGLDQAAVLDLFEAGPYRLVCLAKPENGPVATEPTRGGRLIYSWPLGESGYGLRCFGAAGEEAGLPVDLSFHAVLAPFWGRRLGQTRLDIHHLAHRPARLRAELTSEAVELAGKLQIVYKAVPGELDEGNGFQPA
ncbi:MAG: PhzF family phenazine biosynthesis protein [Candidatus Adiutrix sp.]|jgi:predicted PhzF superfamily epimerase YddE/YHI9|nr:PhzF family phenazine biosynthesis protein [Candidatus Adiutrix sp.]